MRKGGLSFWSVVGPLIAFAPATLVLLIAPLGDPVTFPQLTEEAQAQQLQCCVEYKEFTQCQILTFYCGGRLWSCEFCEGWEAVETKRIQCNPNETSYSDCYWYPGYVVSTSGANCNLPDCFSSFPDSDF